MKQGVKDRGYRKTDDLETNSGIGVCGKTV
jgi:hypothetical protein